MTGLGLFLGGGGTVGVAWENGVLTGLREAGALEPTAANLVVGTSAGSIVGAEIALGRDPSEAIDRHEPLADRPADPPSLTEGPFAEIIGLMMSGAGRTPEGAAEIGRLAVAADTALTTDQFLDRFRHMIGTDGWPSIDLRPTAADCGTGRPRIWTADDGIELWRAVASSCAIPTRRSNLCAVDSARSWIGSTSKTRAWGERLRTGSPKTSSRTASIPRSARLFSGGMDPF